MAINIISESRIRKQAVCYYSVLILWPVYLFLLPPVFDYLGWWVIIWLIFPGLYLFTWLGYLMHESWHRYVPSVNNRFFYNTFALMILSDPQLYFMVHGTHHVHIHTYQDAEFHPLGEIKNRGLRIIYNWLEVLLGVAFLFGVSSFTIMRNTKFSGKYRFWKFPIAIGSWVIFLGTLCFLSHLVFGVDISKALLSYALIYWSGSFLLHQSQLVEHGNLIVDGTIKERNSKTRNFQPDGIIGKAFLFLTHNDSREHLLHHTMTNMYSRPFPGAVSLPDDAVIITLAGYFRILAGMLKGESCQENSARP